MVKQDNKIENIRYAKLDILSLIELKEWAEKEDIDLNDLLIQIKDYYEEVREILE
jgi:hypothetical protein|tara:strand:- start:564 stop:728 length:165 start_codon:yes stop_codon:yes gene_type:complete